MVVSAIWKIQTNTGVEAGQRVYYLIQSGVSCSGKTVHRVGSGRRTGYTERSARAITWRKDFPGSRNRQLNGPEAKGYLAVSQKHQESLKVVGT